MAYLVQTPAL